MQKRVCYPVSHGRPILVVMTCLVGLAACSPAPVTQGINDPNEASNRKVHNFNKAVDTAILKPISSVFAGDGEPGVVSRGVANFADNLSEPSRIVNSLLQFNIGDAGQSTLRFVFNSTFGLAGILDPSTALGVEVKDTDFGETLHVWGAGEGAYVELPFAGPSTVRDAVGTVVDIALNPVRLALPPREAMAATGIKLFSRVGDRDRFSETVESILYDSADSYAQARLLYLQNRRFTLARGDGVAADDEFIDPYEDPYAE